jgi:hypothetical protein
MQQTLNASVNESPQTSTASFYAQQAEMFSKTRAEQYKMEHNKLMVTNGTEGTLLALGRLQALQIHGRAMLDGKFTKREFAGLLSCFQSEIFFPDAIEDMAGAVLDDSDGNQSLADKVANLEHLERYALADLIELSWHNQSDECDVFDIAESLGLKFATSAN